MDVCLVQMPFVALERPSLALGLLKSNLLQNGVETQVLYANLLYAQEIGLERHRIFESSVIEDLIGEWIFSTAAFPDHKSDSTRYFSCLKLPYPQSLLQQARAGAPAFVDRIARRVLADRPRIVGCSSTFQQHCASLALLRRIRELDPGVITIMGGANCEGPMGRTTVNAFPWVDFVVSGEADDLIVPLCRRLLTSGRDVAVEELPLGVFRAGGHHPGANGVTGERDDTARAVVNDLDNIPIPDFSDYFDALVDLPIGQYLRPGLPLETSRGCWWGAKQHCTFCGLNGTGMGFRVKSPDRVIGEIQALGKRYEISKFQSVDNILSMGYFKTVIPALAGIEPSPQIFYETKSNLNREQVSAMAEAGIRWIQPGIESLHDDALRLIKKGCSGSMNLQLLKWALEEGVYVTWNFLAGIPGEQDSWYQDMAAWLPVIEHLQSPGGLGGIVKIRYDRFSPYHERQESYGLNLEPYQTYSHVYPLATEQIADLAYFFENQGDSVEELFTRPGIMAMRNVIMVWQQRFYGKESARPHLTMTVADDCLHITDTRSCAPQERVELSGLERQVYESCDRATSRKGLFGTLAGEDSSLTEAQVFETVDSLCQRLLLLEWGGRLISLAVRPPRRPLPGDREFPGGHILYKPRRPAAPPKPFEQSVNEAYS